MKKILNVMTFATIVTLLAACSLKEEPTSFPNKYTIYKTVPQCQAVLNRCYAHLNNIYVADFMFATEACTDLWSSDASSGDAKLDVSPSKPQIGATVWERGYKGIMDCNEAITCIERSPLDDAKKAPLAAEGRVIRAMSYYILTSMFGGVPYYTCMVDSYHVQDSIRFLERTPADTVRARLYRDLRDNAIPYFTEENGLKVRGGDAPDNRSGYAHGLMLMAKFAMWNACSQEKDAPKDPTYSEEWFRNALEPLNALEDLYDEFSEEKYPLEKTQWKYKNIAESIFEIQHDYSIGGVQYPGNVAPCMTPKYDVQKSDLSGPKPKITYDGGVSLGTNYGANRDQTLKTSNYYALFRPSAGKEDVTAESKKSLFAPLPLTFDLDEKTDGRYMTKIDTEALKEWKTASGQKIDRRVVYVLGFGNLETGDTFDNVRKWGVGWAGPKFWCPEMELKYDSNNYRVFRYADAILMKAEVLAELGNPTCVDYINMVRARAGVDDYVFESCEKAIEFIRDERARELGGEFMRKFDLVRWGIWHEAVKTHSKRTEVRNALPCHRYYPIPDTQCALSGYKLNNPEYENAGQN